MPTQSTFSNNDDSARPTVTGGGNPTLRSTRMKHRPGSRFPFDMLSLTPEEIRELLDDADKFTAKKLRLMAAAATNTDALPATSEEESRVPPAAAEPSVQTEPPAEFSTAIRPVPVGAPIETPPVNQPQSNLIVPPIDADKPIDPATLIDAAEVVAMRDKILAEIATLLSSYHPRSMEEAAARVDLINDTQALFKRFLASPDYFLPHL